MLTSDQLDFLLVLVPAVISGLLIGFEREVHHKPAGLRTHALVAGGACIFTYISLTQGTVEPTRIAAQVVAGIGFLGAGVILKSNDKEDVKYLTTAASIWYTAAIGMCFGYRMFFAGAVATLVILIINNLPKIR
jgi:putative Mg2+ transporter-C (MgtC) family protein